MTSDTIGSLSHVNPDSVTEHNILSSL